MPPLAPNKDLSLSLFNSGAPRASSAPLSPRRTNERKQIAIKKVNEGPRLVTTHRFHTNLFTS